jgi:hypothetical protein
MRTRILKRKAPDSLAAPGMSEFFLAIIVVALGSLIGLFAFVALTL